MTVTDQVASGAPRLGLVRGLLAASALLLAIPAVLSLLDLNVFAAAGAAGASATYLFVRAGTRRPDPVPSLLAARLLAGAALLFLLLAVLVPSLL